MALRAKYLTFVFVVVLCGGLDSVHASERSSALILYPNATDTRSVDLNGTAQLSYHAKGKYPASDVIDWISERLQKAGWKPLIYDPLNPHLPGTRVQHWTYFLNGLEDRQTCVHMWIGDWKDASGDFVRYVFRYEHLGCSVSDLTDLEVFGVYTPADVAHRRQQSFERSKKGHKQSSD